MFRGVHLKSDGTPDLRYKENGGGQANRIYPDNYYGYGGAYNYGSMPGRMPYGGANMYTNAPYGMYGGNYASPIREDGGPDMRFAVNRYY